MARLPYRSGPQNWSIWHQSIHVKRDLYMSKETLTCQKRPTHANRDPQLHESRSAVEKILCIWKETCIYAKRTIHMKRDLQHDERRVYRLVSYTYEKRPENMKRDLYTREGTYTYRVAAIRRLLKVIGLFCKRALSKRRYSAKETFDFMEPSNRRHFSRIECLRLLGSIKSEVSFAEYRLFDRALLQKRPIS